MTFPPGLDTKRPGYFQSTVLCADAKHGHVHGDCFLSPFKLVLICDMYKEAIVSLYDSVSGVWTNFVSTATTDTTFITRPSILVGNAVYWLFYGGDILVFDLERKTLGVIKMPLDNHTTNDGCFHILRMEDGGLGLAVLSELTIKLWERKLNYDGVVEWVIQKTIPLQGILPRCNAGETVIFVGYNEETNVIVLSTIIGNFMLQLDSMQTRHIIKRCHMSYDIFYPYTNFYTAGRGVGWKWLDLKL